MLGSYYLLVNELKVSDESRCAGTLLRHSESGNAFSDQHSYRPPLSSSPTVPSLMSDPECWVLFSLHCALSTQHTPWHDTYFNKMPLKQNRGRGKFSFSTGLTRLSPAMTNKHPRLMHKSPPHPHTQGSWALKSTKWWEQRAWWVLLLTCCYLDVLLGSDGPRNPTVGHFI